MINFEYYTPTKVVFGKGAQTRVGELTAEQNCRRALVHYGGQSAVKSGLLDEVYASLDKAGVKYVSLGGVVPNPRLSLVNRGIELCAANGVDFIVAVGGGSVIDSSKAIGYGIANGGDVWDMYSGKRAPHACLGVGAVLTLAAAGSEMSNSSVITNENGWLKRGCNSDVCRCKFAVLNPELTYSLPAYQTSCGSADIMMHTMERYFTAAPTMQLTDGIAEALIKDVMSAALVALAEPHNYDARAELMWASSLSHNGLTGCGSGGDWACHKLEHELSGMFDVAHGAGLTAVWSSWARYVYKTCPERFAKFARNVMGIAPTGDVDADALAGIAAMERFFRDIDLPTDIPGLGVKVGDAECLEMARKCSNNGAMQVGGFRKLAREDMYAIYKLAAHI